MLVPGQVPAAAAAVAPCGLLWVHAVQAEHPTRPPVAEWRVVMRASHLEQPACDQPFLWRWLQLHVFYLLLRHIDRFSLDEDV